VCVGAFECLRCAAARQPALAVGERQRANLSAELKSRGTEGEVTVQYDVTAQGEVINVRVIASDPPGLFDDAALVAVRTWVFRPQIRAGRVEPVTDITSKLAFQTP
jgi:protein TonB